MESDQVYLQGFEAVLAPIWLRAECLRWFSDVILYAHKDKQIAIAAIDWFSDHQLDVYSDTTKRLLDTMQLTGRSVGSLFFDYIYAECYAKNIRQYFPIGIRLNRLIKMYGMKLWQGGRVIKVNKKSVVISPDRISEINHVFSTTNRLWLANLNRDVRSRVMVSYGAVPSLKFPDSNHGFYLSHGWFPEEPTDAPSAD